MAFTISHLAAAIPFYRSKWLNFEALMIGTMLPDLPYVLGSSSKLSQKSHDWSGIISYCLPSGLVVFSVWHWLVRPAVTALIVPWLIKGDYIALKERKYYPLKDRLVFWLKIALGLMLGAATHLIWDGTTHSDGFIAKQFLWLQSEVKLPYLEAMSGARVLQYLTSIIALAWLARFGFQRLQEFKRTLNSYSLIKDSDKKSKRYLSLLVMSAVASSSIVGGALAGLGSGRLYASDHYGFFAKVLVGVMQGGMLSMVAYAATFKLYYGFQKLQFFFYK